MNVQVNYNEKVERKDTHSKLFSQGIETVSTKSVELLAR